MKKTLALLLAIVMLISVVLVSCNKDKDEEQPTDDFSIPGGSNKPSGTDNGGKSTGTDKPGSKTETFTAATGTMYFRNNVYVCGSAKKGTDGNNVGIALFGESAELLETSASFSHIRFKDSKGSLKEGYVYSEVLTANASDVQVTEYEEKDYKKAVISGLGNKEDGTPWTLRVRTCPWDCAGSKIYKDANILANISNGVYKVTDGMEIVVLGRIENTSGSWYKIRITTKSLKDSTKEVTDIGYCATKYVTVEGETPTTPTTPTTPGAVEVI